MNNKLLTELSAMPTPELKSVLAEARAILLSREPAAPLFLKTETGPLSLEFLIHASVEAYDEDAGFAGACLDYACRWHCHRETIDIFSQAITPFIEKLTEIPRGIDEKNTAKRKAQAVNPNNVTPVPERFLTYINRVFATTSAENKTLIKEEALRLSRTIRISAAPAERKTPIEPMYYKRADSLLSQDIDVINEKLSKFFALVPDFVLARDASEKPLRDSLATLIRRFDEARWALED